MVYGKENAKMHLRDLQIYVISVAKFTDRHKSITDQLSTFGLEPVFIWEYDCEALTVSDRKRCADHRLPDKSISTVLKHIEAQHKLLKSDFNWCLVLEDDALLPPEFTQKMESVLSLITSVNQACLVFLGGTDNRLDPRFFDCDSMSLIESPMTTAEAYLLNRKGCQLRLQWLLNHKIDKPADHFLKSLDEKLGITQFRISEPFISQGSITGVFKTSLDSSRAKHGATYLQLKFEWNRFRKQTLPRMWAKISKHVL